LARAECVQVFDYVGGSAFLGVVVNGRTLVLRAEEEEDGWAGIEVKEGLVALLDLAIECLGCATLVLCVDRTHPHIGSLIRDLGWIGFDLVPSIVADSKHPAATAAAATPNDDVLFFSMDL